MFWFFPRPSVRSLNESNEERSKEIFQILKKQSCPSEMLVYLFYRRLSIKSNCGVLNKDINEVIVSKCEKILKFLAYRFLSSNAGLSNISTNYTLFPNNRCKKFSLNLSEGKINI